MQGILSYAPGVLPEKRVFVAMSTDKRQVSLGTMRDVVQVHLGLSAYSRALVVAESADTAFKSVRILPLHGGDTA